MSTAYEINSELQIELIYAGIAVVRLSHSNYRCLCGQLTGNPTSPASHVRLECPIARFYAAVDAIAAVSR